MDSGLGVPLLSQTMPPMRSKRLGRLGLSEDPVILAMVEYVATRPAVQKHLQASTSRTCIINTSGALHSALADQLHRSFDGRGLTSSAMVTDQHRWIHNPPKTTTGRSFVDAVVLCGNLLPTALCASRGRPDAPTFCGAVTWTHTPGVPLVSWCASWDTIRLYSSLFEMLNGGVGTVQLNRLSQPVPESAYSMWQMTRLILNTVLRLILIHFC